MDLLMHLDFSNARRTRRSFVAFRASRCISVAASINEE